MLIVLLRVTGTVSRDFNQQTLVSIKSSTDSCARRNQQNKVVIGQAVLSNCIETGKNTLPGENTSLATQRCILEHCERYTVYIQFVDLLS